uniref:Small ribosomal subunit protein uS19c n=1 Tax=Ephedra foeminea TaxID=157595 RepID=A0A8F4TFS9_9SPER|nr:ribosomal protein S19 [Ephedra foeminea]QXG16921.1 ribosomal protein S19 [Ephedra foeminea]
MKYSRKKKSLKQVFAATHSKKKVFIADHLFKKIEKLDTNIKKKKILLTWSRASTVVPKMIGYTIAIHNGKEHIPIYITNNMLYYKLGDFVPTRLCPEHPGKDDKKSKKDKKSSR